MGDGLVAKALRRIGEIAMAIICTRRAKGGMAFVGNMAKLVVLAAAGWLLVEEAAPVVVYAATILKSGGDLSGGIEAYAAAGGGWGVVRAMGAPHMGDMEAAGHMVALAVWAIIAVYAVREMRRSSRRTIFGVVEGVKLARGARTDAKVEVSDTALASTTRTWRPGESIDHAGLVLGYSPLLHRYYLSGEEEHTQLIAPPGVGKTTRAVYPTLHAVLCSQDSAIVFDPKGELYDNTSAAAERSGARVIVIDYADWRRSDLYNPLSAVTQAYMDGMRRAESASDDVERRNWTITAMSNADARAQDLAEAMIPDKEGNDHFWRPSSRSLARALFLYVGTYRPCDWVGEGPAPCEPDDDQRSLKTVRHLLDAYGKAQRRKVGNATEDYIPLEGLFAGLSDDNPARKAFAQAKNSPNVTLGGIISTLLQVIDSIVSEESNHMSYGMSFSFADIARERTVVYLVVPEEQPAKFVYLPIFTVQAYQSFARLARECGGKMPRNVHFICEEMGNTPEIPRLANMVGTGRGYGIRFHFVLQNPYQWAVEYGDKVSESLRASINSTLYLKVNDNRTAKELSEAIGNVTVQIESSSVSAPAGSVSIGTVQRQVSTTEVPLVPVSKILEWDPLWGSFCRRSRIEQGKLLNRLVFHRHESTVALYPTVKAKRLPTMRAFGLRGRRAASVAAAARAVDKSAGRRSVPPWRPYPDGAPKVRPVAAGSHPDPGIASGAAREAARADLSRGVRAAIEDERKRVKRLVVLANRLCKSMEASSGLGPPWSCESDGFRARRAAVRDEWMAAFEAAVEGREGGFDG